MFLFVTPGLTRGPADQHCKAGPRVKPGVTIIAKRPLTTLNPPYKFTVASIHKVQPPSASNVPKVATTPIWRPSGALPGGDGV